MILVCADGCGWGKNAQLAARIAVLSMLKHVTDNIAQGVFTTEGDHGGLLVEILLVIIFHKFSSLTVKTIA